jgi:hypothetical protein
MAKWLLNLIVDVPESREIVIKLPDDIPVGKVKLKITITPVNEGELTWAERNALAVEKEAAAFERMKAELIEKYEGQYVVIYKEKVVGHGDDERVLLDQFYKEYGEDNCYLERAAWDTPRRVRIPSFWIVRE